MASQPATLLVISKEGIYVGVSTYYFGSWIGCPVGPGSLTAMPRRSGGQRAEVPGSRGESGGYCNECGGGVKGNIYRTPRI